MNHIERIRNLPTDQLSRLVRAGGAAPEFRALLGEILVEGIMVGAMPPATQAQAEEDERVRPKRGPTPKKARGKKGPKKAASAGGANGAATGKPDGALLKVKTYLEAHQHTGASVSEIQKGTKPLTKQQVQRCLRVLKEDGVAFMGGERRFARWATTQAKANDASQAARGGE